MSSFNDPGHRDLPPAEDPPDRFQPDKGGPDRDPDSDDGALNAGRLVWLLVGAGAIAAGTALGWDASALAAIVSPPALIRAALIGLGVAVGVVLLLGALERLASPAVDGGTSRGVGARDIATMIRGVRLVFLAVAALAASSAWILGHPLPLVIALVIAGVDVLETSFLLLVVSLRSRG